eukprot:comp19208_c0_seq1/m.21942 comp19208_c0_seq1/g.21942  ORF comp19208_c0_seq1/g.21942 comp19208_c0_seq1/m.21942 type:complete len:140 (-) comp19208_c0_seq1:284-703(-)
MTGLATDSTSSLPGTSVAQKDGSNQPEPSTITDPNQTATSIINDSMAAITDLTSRSATLTPRTSATQVAVMQNAEASKDGKDRKDGKDGNGGSGGKPSKNEKKTEEKNAEDRAVSDRPAPWWHKLAACCLGGPCVRGMD